MKIRIGGSEYPVVSHRSANLLHLIELREQTRKLFDEPLGMARLDQIERVSRALRDKVTAAKKQRALALEAGDEAAVAASDELIEQLNQEQVDDGLLSMAIIIFLSRRKAGERITFAQAVNVDIAEDVEWISEPDDALPVTPDEDTDSAPTDGATATPDPHMPARGSRATRAGARSEAQTKKKRAAPTKGGHSMTSPNP